MTHLLLGHCDGVPYQAVADAVGPASGGDRLVVYRAEFAAGSTRCNLKPVAEWGRAGVLSIWAATDADGVIPIQTDGELYRSLNADRPVLGHPDALPAEARAVVARTGTRFLALVPILGGGTLVGALSVARVDRAGAMSEQELMRLRPVADSIGQAVLRYESDQRARREHRAMEQSLRGADLGSWWWHPSTGEARCNDRYATMLGLDPQGFRPSYAFWRRAMHPDDAAEAVGRFQDHIDGHTDSYEAEFRLRHRDGHWVWVLARGAAVERDENGRALAVAGTHLDISDRKAMEHRQHQFMRELDHRVRNNLATVLAMIGRLRSETDDVEQFAARLRDRVAGLAHVHQLLAKRRWQPTDLRSLLVEMLPAYADPHRFDLRGPALAIGTGQAGTLGTILNELATNACKHGAWVNGAGSVSVTWRIAPEGRVEMLWQERGESDGSEAPSVPGMGMTMVCSMIEFELDGMAHFERRPEGLRCRLVWPHRDEGTVGGDRFGPAR